MRNLDWKAAAGVLQVLQQPAVLARLANVVSVLLVVLLAYSAARLTWGLFPPVEQEVVVPTTLSSPKPGSFTAAGQSAVNADIAKWHLFGEASAVSVATTPKEPIRETQLRLELRGVIASDDEQTARAIIADEARKENFYAVESQLPGGAVLKEIHTDHIILSRNSRLETLRLPKDRLDAGGGSEISTRDAEQDAFGQEDMIEPAMPPGVRSNVFDDAGDSLSDVRDALLNDPQSLMGLLQAAPEIENGTIVGYKLGRGQDPRMLRRFGLRHGDVVTAVNGIQLDGPTKLPELLQALPNAQQVRIEYKRRGHPRSVVLNMDN